MLTGFILSFALVAGATPAVAKYEPPGGAIFNMPRPWGTDGERFKIVRTIETALRHISPTKKDPKPFVLVTSYLFDRRSSVDALIGACKRDVSVRVILDEDIINNSGNTFCKVNIVVTVKMTDFFIIQSTKSELKHLRTVFQN